MLPGEFATQTCFQGRFGEDTETNKFGGHVMMHPPRPNEDLVKARIQYTEFRIVGQAFRIGRYAIHFHLVGKADNSYVRGCAIHKR